ncbi:MAG: RluA family pseudouridine synthase [Pirellulaceae bacterium]|nr:RluA family pseudouridine synthase [Pirellulaceae bacterium]
MLDILLEEAHFLVINKPSGLFSQSAAGIENVQEMLVQQLAARDSHPGRPFIGLPHRLDRGTSGVMLLARNQRALKRFGEQFHSRKVAKHYIAVVHGIMPPGRVRLSDYLRKIPEKPLAEIVSAESDGAKLAELDAEPLVSEAGFTLVNIQLLTGRMHQIRLQLASRGYPVLGDWSYGSSQTFGPLDPEGFRQCLALHCQRLEFRHPQTAKACSVSAPVSEHWSCLPDSLLQAVLK